MTTKKPAGAQALVTPLGPAAVAEKLRDEIRRMAANTPYWEALEAARAAPISALLDELALHDLVGLEIWMPQNLNDEHARQTWECINRVRSATDSMRANYWLRRAMVHSKDFMLWDDSAAYDRHRGSQKMKAERDRTTLNVQGEKLRKRDLVNQALAQAGSQAGTADVWGHLCGYLDQLGMGVQEEGAKDQRKLTAVDDAGKSIVLTFKGVQTMLRVLRAGGAPSKRGRPAKKPVLPG